MPWNRDDYPNTLKNFTAPVRNKAIDIANALLEDGYEEGRAKKSRTAFINACPAFYSRII